MKGFSDFLDMKRCKDWDHEISFRKYLSLSKDHTEIKRCFLLGRKTMTSFVQSLANTLGKYQFIVDKQVPICN